MSTKKKIIFIFLIIILLFGLYAYREFNRKPTDLAYKDSSVKVSANDLVQEYNKDEIAANKKYLGNVITVFGSIAAAENNQDTSLTILMGSNENGKVSCLFDDKHLQEAKSYTVGDTVMIKGICTGFLMDVELNKCLIVKK
jgi:uncharacterized protein (DUF1330 family)